MKYNVNVFVNGQEFKIQLKEWESLFVNEKYIHDVVISMFGKVKYKVMAKLPSFKGLLEMEYDGLTFSKCGLIK